MRINRYYTDQNITGEDMSIRDKDLLHRLSGVMRYKVEEMLKLFDGKESFDYVYAIRELNKKEGYLTFVSKEENISNVTQKVHLYTSIIKTDFDDAVRSMVEIGVNEITPVVSDRVERKEVNYERLNKIILEASEQCGRWDIPKLNPVIKLKEISLEKDHQKSDSSHNICYHTKIVSQNKNNKLNEGNHETKNLIKNIFIGPEGGWTDSEIEWFLENKFEIKNIRTNILKAKTAALICLYDAMMR